VADLFAKPIEMVLPASLALTWSQFLAVAIQQIGNRVPLRFLRLEEAAFSYRGFGLRSPTLGFRLQWKGLRYARLALDADFDLIGN
jgi:hypothetical protein